MVSTQIMVKCGNLHVLLITNRFCANNIYKFINNCMQSAARWVQFTTQVSNQGPIRVIKFRERTLMDKYNCFSKLLHMPQRDCEVPENIHTPLTIHLNMYRRYWNFLGGGGSLRSKHCKQMYHKSFKYQNFQRSGSGGLMVKRCRYFLVLHI